MLASPRASMAVSLNSNGRFRTPHQPAGLSNLVVANQLLKSNPVKLWNKLLILKCSACHAERALRGWAPIERGYDHRYSIRCWQAIPRASPGSREAERILAQRAPHETGQRIGGRAGGALRATGQECGGSPG